MLTPCTFVPAPQRWLTILAGIVLLTVTGTNAQNATWCDVVPRANGNGTGLNFTILPMGASIVYGLMSTDGNGFRLGLQNLLQANGTQTTMVGTQFSGNMTDNHHEAYEAVTIDQYNNLSYHSGAYEMNANVLLVLVGTNDCWYVKPQNGTEAAVRFGYLLDSVKAKAPNALVIASTLPRNANEWCGACQQDFNAHLPAVVQDAAERGLQVRLVDMYDVVPLDHLNADGTHPDEFGYLLMSQQWYDALLNATMADCADQAAASVTASSTASSTETAAKQSASPPTASEADALSSLHAMWMLVPFALWALAA